MWKARNEIIFEGKKLNPQAVLVQAVALTNLQTIANPVPNKEYQEACRYEGKCVLIDASWDNMKRVGIGVMMFDEGGMLENMLMEYEEAYDLFHVEAIMLKRAMEWVGCGGLRRWSYKVAIFTDCKNLVEAVRRRNLDDIPSWQATKAVQKCIQWSKREGNSVIISHVSRVTLSLVHRLANIARAQGITLHGDPTTVRVSGVTLPDTVDDTLFQRSE